MYLVGTGLLFPRFAAAIHKHELRRHCVYINKNKKVKIRKKTMQNIVLLKP